MTTLTFHIVVSLSPSADLDTSKDNGDTEREHLGWTANLPPAGAVQIKQACLTFFDCLSVSSPSLAVPLSSPNVIILQIQPLVFLALVLQIG